MGMGKNWAIVGIYGKHQLVQFNNSPLVISLLAEEGAPTGLHYFPLFLLVSVV